ncbi:MAG: ompA family protein [Micavibrio sp.]|nr:ompA family protein [Micavibrio sp.]
MKLLLQSLFITIVLAFSANAATLLVEKDIVDGSDSAVLIRYTGSWLIAYENKGFDEADIPTAESKVVNEQFAPSQKIQGKITRFVYLAPVGRSVLEVHSNYTDALEKSGFQKQFSCEKILCRLGGASVIVPYIAASRTFKQVDRFGSRSSIGFGFLNYHDTDGIRFSIYRKTVGSQDTYVTIMSHPYSGVGQDETQLFNRTGTFIEIIEPKAMQTGMVDILDAAKMQQTLRATGHVSLYGIYFDLDKADVKPESKPALDQMAEMLTKNPALKLYVVGHTDSQGQIAHNADLSRRRAASIMAALVTTYKIGPSRLQSVGLASYAPVASNSSEEGRQKNRRVELVEQ